MFYSHDFEILYSDIDKNNKLKLSSLFNFFQEAGCLHSSFAGYGLNDVSKTRVAWLIINWKAQIFTLPSWNEKIHLVTWSRNEDNIYAYRDFEVFDEKNNLIAKCSSKWVLINVDTERLCKLTDEISNSFNPEKKCTFDTPFSKLKEPTNYISSFNYSVLKRDIDTNNHLNNNIYLQIAQEVLPENLNFNYVEVLYKHAAKLGENIVCLYSKNDDNEHFVTIKSEDLKMLHAIIKFS